MEIAVVFFLCVVWAVMARAARPRSLDEPGYFDPETGVVWKSRR